MGSLVTLVMSDIVGSTRRWAADEVAMAADLEQHDRILGDAVGEAGGTLVKHTGDGMLAVFDDPVSAASAAVARSFFMRILPVAGALPVSTFVSNR